MDGAKKELEGGDGVFFDGIAHRYDGLNRIISLGMDSRWRRKAVDALDLSPNAEILDVATGTGDLAIAIARRDPTVSVVGIDPSVGMLDVGRDKIAAADLTDRIEMIEGDGQDMPFDDDRFDGAVVSFGIRNFPDRLQGLHEMTRVVKPGGTVVILELREPDDGLIGTMSRWYVHGVVPRIGGLLSGRKEYEYLQESIAAFPPPEKFRALMTEVGLQDVESRPLTMGAVEIFVGRKPS